MKAQGIKRLVIAVAAFAASLSLSQLAVAESPRPAKLLETKSVTIDVTGLNLSSPAGARRLYEQIAAAAKTVCRSHSHGYRGILKARHERVYVQPCVQGAIDGALAQIADATGLDLERVAALDRRKADGLAAIR